MKIRHERLIHPWSFWPIVQPSDTEKPQQPRQLTPAERKAWRRWLQRTYEREWRIRNRELCLEYSRSYRERHPERTRQASRRWRAKMRADSARWEEYRLKRAVYYRDHHEQALEYSRQWKRDHPEKAREHARNTRLRNLERCRLRDRIYGREHRKQKLAYMRERYLKTHPDARTGREIARDAYLFAERVMELHASGLTWREVAERVGRSEQACKMAQWHERQRLGIPPRHEARQLEEQVIALRNQGLSWPKIGKALGKTGTGCWCAYQRAMKRQQREDGAA